MKTTTLVISLAFLSTSLSFAGGEGWMHDFEAAKKKAAAEKKDLLVDFTGSDWCGWCIKLSDEVFKKEPFSKGVADKYILVELDYPQDTSGMDEATIAQNEKLKDSYAIQGYPTILLMDAEGRPYAQTGYQPGGPEAYLKHLDELQVSKKDRDDALAVAATAEGVDKAKALVAVLQILPEGQESHYGSITEEIIKNDPEDTTGFAAAKKAQEDLGALEQTIQTAMEAGKRDEALSAVDEFIKSHELKGMQKQEILSIKFSIVMENQDFDAASKILDEVVAIDPKSQYGMGAASFKPRLEAMKAKASEEGEKEDKE